MTKLQIQLTWGKIIREIHKRPELGERLKKENISRLGDLLLSAQILLSKIEAGKNVAFNEMIYKKTMDFYYVQMKKYARFDY